MTFLWPELLWLLLALPVLVGIYLYLIGRKHKRALAYASLSGMREAMEGAGRLRRHVPPALFLFALIVMVVAIARPAAVVMLPSAHKTVMLAMDVSGSMRATDVEPNRMAAAQTAARAFVNDLPSATRIGIVSFAATASLVQAPTSDREDILAAIDRFQLQRGTAVGSGILISLKALFPDMEFDLRSNNPRTDAARATSLDAPAKSGKEQFKPVPPGSYDAAVVILLTDGQTNTGPDPVEAARMAADRGVRIYTVGIGTPAGELIGAEGWSMRVRLDEAALKNIANVTLGQYFYAGTATDLKKVYESLNSKLVLEKHDM